MLFDYLLNGFGDLFGLRAAEKIVVPLCVLMFFWGLFALVSAAARRAPWMLVPCLALVAYGWTFHMGFFNYYLSLGFAFFGVAILWRGKGWERLAAVALAPLIVVAHPFGLIWLAGAGAYVAIAEIANRAAIKSGCFLLAWRPFLRRTGISGIATSWRRRPVRFISSTARTSW